MKMAVGVGNLVSGTPIFKNSGVRFGENPIWGSLKITPESDGKEVQQNQSVKIHKSYFLNKINKLLRFPRSRRLW